MSVHITHADDELDEFGDSHSEPFRWDAMSVGGEEFKCRVRAVWGDAGDAWLVRLPTILAQCAEHWNLVSFAPVAALSYNFVAAVTLRDGREAILKIGVPNPELTTEIQALRCYQGRQAVRLLDADLDNGALLLQRLRPGTPLTTLQDDAAATAIAAQLMRDLPIPAPAEHQLPTLECWATAFAHYRRRFPGNSGPLPPRFLEKALALFGDLQRSAPPSVLLHGDLHHDNILSHGEQGWLAIDPKGVIGDPAYEAARFQHNPLSLFRSSVNLQAVVEQRGEILSALLGIDQTRLFAWAFFDAMLCACWCVEEHSADWRLFLSSAQILDGLVD